MDNVFELREEHEKKWQLMYHSTVSGLGQIRKEASIKFDGIDFAGTGFKIEVARKDALIGVFLHLAGEDMGGHGAKKEENVPTPDEAKSSGNRNGAPCMDGLRRTCNKGGEVPSTSNPTLRAASNRARDGGLGGVGGRERSGIGRQDSDRRSDSTRGSSFQPLQQSSNRSYRCWRWARGFCRFGDSSK